MGVSVTRTIKYIRKGDSAVNYYITLSAKTFATDSTGKPTNTSDGITIRAYKQIGNNSAVLLSGSNGDNWAISAVIRTGGTNLRNYASNSNADLVISAPTTAFDEIMIDFSVTLNLVTQSYQKESIMPLKQGSQGSVGATLRGPQAWSDMANGYSFQAGNQGDAWKDVVLYNSNYYSCIKDHTKSSTNYPTSTEDNNNGYWQLGDKIELVATKILLATYALVKNLGVEAIDMKDAGGNILFQAKDGNVTCKTGTFENVTVSGILNGVSGSFKSLDCVNDSGVKVGGISFGSDGRMWFEGDLYSQGTAPSGRPYRFYGSDMWCRATFGARQRSVLRVIGASAYYYPNGIDGSSVAVSLTQRVSSNQVTYYVIDCYGQAGDYAGMPIDVVAFNINSASTYVYELNMSESQRVLIVNGNNSQNNVQIFTHGGLVTYNGGAVGEVVKISVVENPATVSGTLGKGLFTGPIQDNNW